MALLESGQGGDVNEIRNGHTMLYQAVVDQEIGAIEALLRHGADTNLGRPARVVGTLLRAGATIEAEHAEDPTLADLEDIEFECHEFEVKLRKDYAWELSIYFREVLAAGGFENYGRARRAPFVAMLDRGLSLPRDAISVVCEFWLRADEYHPDTNLYTRFC